MKQIIHVQAVLMKYYTKSSKSLLGVDAMLVQEKSFQIFFRWILNLQNLRFYLL